LSGKVEACFGSGLRGCLGVVVSSGVVQEMSPNNGNQHGHFEAVFGLC